MASAAGAWRMGGRRGGGAHKCGRARTRARSRALRARGGDSRRARQDRRARRKTRGWPPSATAAPPGPRHCAARGGAGMCEPRRNPRNPWLACRGPTGRCRWRLAAMAPCVEMLRLCRLREPVARTQPRATATAAEQRPARSATRACSEKRPGGTHGRRSSAAAGVVTPHMAHYAPPKGVGGRRAACSRRMRRPNPGPHPRANNVGRDVWRAHRPERGNRVCGERASGQSWALVWNGGVHTPSLPAKEETSAHSRGIWTTTTDSRPTNN